MLAELPIDPNEHFKDFDKLHHRLMNVINYGIT